MVCTVHDDDVNSKMNGYDVMYVHATVPPVEAEK